MDRKAASEENWWGLESGVWGKERVVVVVVVVVVCCTWQLVGS